MKLAESRQAPVEEAAPVTATSSELLDFQRPEWAKPPCSEGFSKRRRRRSRTTPSERQAIYEDRATARPKEAARFYHRLLEHYFRFLIPPGARVLEVGCGLGDLLASVKPSYGVGVDFSAGVIDVARQRHPDLAFHVSDSLDFLGNEPFDYIIISDLVNELPDVQAFFAALRDQAHSRTRVLVNFFNNLWRPILSLAERIGAKAPTPPQSWLSAADVENLLYLAGWEVIKTESRILWPLPTPLLAGLLNRWMASLPGLRHFCLTVFQVARLKPAAPSNHYTCTVVVPARNEAGNIEEVVQRIPHMGRGTEILFVEGHSLDHTWEEIQRVQAAYPEHHIRALKQRSTGKGGAVREAFAAASGELLFILDADLTMPPEELPKFYEVVQSGMADFANGVRLVYPMEEEAMRFMNMVANKFFSLAFGWLLGQPIKDTLCGTKVLLRSDYEAIARNRSYFGDFDPFGDFDLLFGAAKLNLRMSDLPIRYQARTYGTTNIQRWRHGWLLLRMVFFAARRMKFI
jgi:SAM-dependent methyltransferase